MNRVYKNMSKGEYKFTSFMCFKYFVLKNEEIRINFNSGKLFEVQLFIETKDHSLLRVISNSLTVRYI